MAAAELPFLYQTRTILRRPLRGSSSRRSRRSCIQSCLSTSSYGHFGRPASEPANIFAQKSKERTSKTVTSQFVKPSITRSEKRVFEDIFEDISTFSSLKPAPGGNALDVDPDNILKLFSSPVQEEIPAPSPGWPVLQESRNGAKSEHYEDVLTKYSKPLRNAAQKATAATIEQGAYSQFMTDFFEKPKRDMGPYQSFQPFTSQRWDTEPPASPFEGPEDHVTPLPSHHTTSTATCRSEFYQVDTSSGLGPQLESCSTSGTMRTMPNASVEDFVHRQMRIIAAGLQNAISRRSSTGAFQMWEICRNHIFPIVKLLEEPPTIGQEEIYAVSLSALDATSTGSQNNASESMTASPGDGSKLELPSDIKPLDVVTQLYPAALLLVLRLFFKHFPTSPFPLAMLSHIRSQGATSYVLGVNTHFYNTLINLQFNVYSDLKGIDRILSEMEKSGVEFDAGTLHAILSIEEARWKDLKHGKDESEPGGSRGAQWWARPEQVKYFQSVGVEWKNVISRRLQEQGLGDVVSEREYRAVVGRTALHGGALESADSPGVWI